MVVFDNGFKTVELAEPSGFCFGVSEALEKVDTVIDEYTGKASGIFTLGPIIHNKAVIKELEEKGVFSKDNIEEVPNGSVLIIRTHGVSKTVEDETKIRDIIAKDATCPHVKKIHKLVEAASTQDRPIIIIGNTQHPEVIAIKSRCGENSFIIQKQAEAIQIMKQMSVDSEIQSKDILVVAQTTISEEMWNECIKTVIDYFPDANIKKTICSATSKRQQACAELAEKSDLMIIIGDKNSSNSMKLYEISRKICKNSFFIEGIEDLPLKEILKCNRRGTSAGASTPARIIKEVISAMSEDITMNNEEENGMQGFMEEIERSLRLPGRGEIVTGDVILVNDREVVINLGCKKDGIIPKEEIALEPGQDLKSLFHEGDSVQAKVVKTDDGYGNILLSKKKLEVNEHWDEIIVALDDKSFVNVKVVKEVKGGVIAVYKEVSGFIPMSQLSDKYTEKADEFIGQVLPVRVTRVDQKRNKAVFSHKSYLNELKAKKISEIWESLNVGDVVEGTVMRFTDYGAFVDIGGIDGLLHISEISWGKLKHPQEALKIGEKINVKILSMNSEKGKISLGLKQNTPEPWTVINEKYTVGQIVEGKVVQIKEYGAFVELEPGLDGLVHISEIAFKRVTNIADELKIGQTVSAKILEIDEEKKRISLSIKETLDSSSEFEHEENETPSVVEESLESDVVQETETEDSVIEETSEDEEVVSSENSAE